jgi:glycine/D-amino acid oxidase-like deaminating enzyme
VPALLSNTYQERCLWQLQAADRFPEPAAGGLPNRVDVLVVGAGYCGLAAADALARAGRSVLVLDREPLGWGASSRNGGMVIPELKAGPAALERRHGSAGRRMYAEVGEAYDFVESVVTGADGRGGVDCSWSPAGQLYLAHSAAHVDDLRAMAREHGEVLGEPARFVDTEALRAEVGSDAFHAGVVFERTAGLHPARFHAGLARRAAASGAVVHDRTAVTALRRDGSAVAVSTTRGTVSARQAIVATNAYMDSAVPWLERRVLPVGSYIIATEVLDPALAASVSPTGRMMVDTKNFLFYWRLTPDGRVAFGGRRSLDPVDVAEARDHLYDSMLRIHPQLEGVAVEHAWGGVVALTLDRLPHVGLVDGAWYATGCNGSGVALNTWLGDRLAKVVLGEAPPPACAEIPHRAIPARAWRAAYLPLVSRWFSWRDSR